MDVNEHRENWYLETRRSKRIGGTHKHLIVASENTARHISFS